MVSGPNVHGSMEKMLTDWRNRLTIVERRLAVQGGVDLSARITAGDSITVSGAGTDVDPLVISNQIAVATATDWNTTVDPGFYLGAQGIPGAPSLVPFPMHGIVTAIGGGHVRQSLSISLQAVSAGGEYLRGEWVRTSQDNGATWTLWRQATPLSGTGTVAGSGGNSTGTTAVPFPVGYFQSAPLVVCGQHNLTSGATILGAAFSITTSGFDMRVSQASASSFSGTYTIPFIAQEN